MVARVLGSGGSPPLARLRDSGLGRGWTQLEHGARDVRPDFGFLDLRTPRDAAPGRSFESGRFELDEFFFSCSRSCSSTASTVVCGCSSRSRRAFASEFDDDSRMRLGADRQRPEQETERLPSRDLATMNLAARNGSRGPRTTRVRERVRRSESLRAGSRGTRKFCRGC